MKFTAKDARANVETYIDNKNAESKNLSEMLLDEIYAMVRSASSEGRTLIDFQVPNLTTRKTVDFLTKELKEAGYCVYSGLTHRSIMIKW